MTFQIHPSFAPLLDNYSHQRRDAVPKPLIRKYEYSIVHQV